MLCAAFVFSIGCVDANADANVLGWKAGWTPADTSKTDALAANGLLQLARYEVFSGESHETCNLANAAVRRDW